MVGEACRQLAEWQSRPETAQLHLSLNLSARELTHPDVVANVLGCVRESGVDPHYLTIEVTESTAMADGDSGFRALRELSHEGIRVAIDDFGTGYSSMSYLRRLPVDIVKIDQSFVRGVASGSTESILVHSIVDLAETLNIGVIAEGVEEEAQAEALRALRCQTGQGYLWSRPVPPDQIADLVRSFNAPVPYPA